MQGLEAVLGERKYLLVGALLLGHLAARDQALPLEFGQCRIDGAETGLVNVTERAFLEGLFDFVTAGVAAAECAEAEDLRVHEWLPVLIPT